MSAVPAEIIYPVVSDWLNCYGESWRSDLVPEAFSHPAKYSRALIRRIYDHASEEGWIRPGSTVVDPFGGIAGGALDAMLRGCHWKGCELETRFVELGSQNLALWNERYSRMPSWGTAELRQGDSRRLSDVFPCSELAVSSPPYAGNYKSDRTQEGRDERRGFRQGKGCFRSSENYGQTDGNLGSLPATAEGFDCAVSSPPYATTPQRNDKDYAESKIEQAKASGGTAARATWGFNKGSTGQQGYGVMPGQLGGMKDAGFDAAISSPPFADAGRKDGRPQGGMKTQVARTKSDGSRLGISHYGTANGQLGIASNVDFWQASRLILEQLYQVLTPGAHACFVTKRFVRNKQIVEFSAQWAALCEAVGFGWLHHHRCWLVERHGTQATLTGEVEDVTTERKSFFRRLAEKKGSPRIDYEDVLCFVKPS